MRGSQRGLKGEPMDRATGGIFHVHGPPARFDAMDESFTLPADPTPG